MGDQQTGGAGNAGGGAVGGASSGDSSQTQQSNQGQSAKTVSWENHQRALDDMHSFKKKVLELEAKLGDVESEKLKAANNYQALYEQEKQKREQAEKKASDTLSWAANTQRFNEVKAVAQSKGLKKEALSDLEILDLDGIKVETTSTGRFIVEGAPEWVDKLKNDRPHWFGDLKPPGINSGGGGGGTPPGGGGNAKVTVADLVTAEQHLKRGKISKAQYDDMYMRYVKSTGKVSPIQADENA